MRVICWKSYPISSLASRGAFSLLLARYGTIGRLPATTTSAEIRAAVDGLTIEWAVEVRLLPGSVPRLGGLLGVYRAYAPRYKELIERIDRTDWLIDQIVYQLYGLTDEEIAIVEGRA